ncbi:hypothetical protein F5Y17DRAFT_433162 [Xylariaceae sp. FL0594]|nr:hypothetical protein F5Y17DRAFT_433162 [Xylariaceae sp. FL0594]
MVSRPCGNIIQGLSLVPRGSRSLPSNNASFLSRHWISSTSKHWFPSAGGVEYGVDSGRQIERNDPGTTSQPSSDETGQADLRRRYVFRRIAKTRQPSKFVKPLIRPATSYPNRRESHNSLRKHVASARGVALAEFIGEKVGKKPVGLNSVLNYMLKNTPAYREVLDFKLRIEKKEVLQTHANLLEFEMKVRELQWKHECRLRMESADLDDEPISISISGTNISIRDFLSELVVVVGKVSAVKVLGQAQDASLPEYWAQGSDGGRPIPTPRSSTAHAAEIERKGERQYFSTYLVGEYGSGKRRPYTLTHRADQIPRPSVWTERSFEQYVGDLVHAQVPNHLKFSLYPVGTADHQCTVVGLLTELFTSEDLQPFISPSALKMALSYIYKRGSVFLPEARIIFHQAELRRLLDAETFQASLARTSQTGDLRSFQSALVALCQRGHYIGAGVWKAFLKMIKDPNMKLKVMKAMRTRRIHLLPSVQAEMGRQTAHMYLQLPENRDKKIRLFLAAQNREYGAYWLSTMMLNQMLDTLGAHGNFEACEELLDPDKLQVPLDEYTLNIMMTHSRTMAQKIDLLTRWPKLRPDAASYQLLFSTAWKQDFPNMLGVIWRYSVFAGHTSSKMRRLLTMLLRNRRNKRKGAWLLQKWESIVFGRDQLAAARHVHADGPENITASTIIKQYLDEAGSRRPLDDLGPKLRAAYEMDIKLKDLGEDAEPDAAETLTVEIPLGFPANEH